MSKYLLSIIGTVLLSAFLTAILPDGKTNGVIKAVARLACTLAIIAPILQFFQSGTAAFVEVKKTETIFSQSVIDAEESFIHYYSELRIRETEKALTQDIAEKYGIEVSVSIDWKKEEKEIFLEKIYVNTMEQQNEEALKNMWEYLTKNYCSEVLIE